MSVSVRTLLVFPLLVVLSCTTAVPQPPSGSRHVELARAGYQAFARGDVPAVIALMDQAIVWHEAESLPYGGVHRGPDAVLQNVFMALGRDWQPFSVTPQQYINAGDSVVVLGEYRGTNRATGRSFKAPFVHIWRFESDHLVEFHQLTDTALWLAAMDGK